MDLIQAACLTPAFDFLEKQGVNIGNHIAAVGLGEFESRNPRSWLPKRRVFRLIERLNRRELSDTPIEDLESAYRLSNTHHYGRYMLSAPNMLIAAKRATDSRYKVITYHEVQIGLQTTRASVRSLYNHRREEAERIIEGLSLVLMLDALVEFGPDKCSLSSLDITLDRLPETSLPINWSKTKIRTSRPEHKATFPLSWLPRRARSKVRPLSTQGWSQHYMLSDRIVALFDALEQGKRPTLDLISESTGVAKRTIQRNLAREQTSFVKLLDEWTAQKALVEINDPNVSLVDLSERLGYSDPAHFTRAFRRWMGRSPKSYRDTVI